LVNLEQSHHVHDPRTKEKQRTPWPDIGLGGGGFLCGVLGQDGGTDFSLSSAPKSSFQPTAT
jgi:hypothetical protein